MKKVEWAWCFARISRIRAVGADDPPASKVKAISGLLVSPISISAADTGCTSGGVSQDEEVRTGRSGAVRLLGVPLQPTKVKETSRNTAPRTGNCALCRSFCWCRSCISYASLADVEQIKRQTAALVSSILIVQHHVLAKDRGCTKPDCDAHACHRQVHHFRGWATTRRTDINDLTLRRRYPFGVAFGVLRVVQPFSTSLLSIPQAPKDS
jgi:hypothetical protein